MKAWESSRKKQREADRHDVIAGSITIFGMGLMFVSAVAFYNSLTYSESIVPTIGAGSVFTIGALLLEAGLFLDKIFKLKDGRKK